MTQISHDVRAQLADFDAYMEGILRDWNAPGIGVGVVIDKQLVFVGGYGYRDFSSASADDALQQSDV